MNKKEYINKPIFNNNSIEIVCQTCLWLIQFPGGDCKCALEYPWPSGTDTPDKCKFYVANKSSTGENSDE